MQRTVADCVGMVAIVADRQRRGCASYKLTMTHWMMMMMPNLDQLITVFEEAKALIAHPDNDFSWSSWIDQEHALAELDAIIAALRSGGRPSLLLGILFAPTGPMQEVSLSSGWGQEFLALAERFDAAMVADEP